MTVTKGAARTARVFYDFIQRKLGVQERKARSTVQSVDDILKRGSADYRKVKYLPSVALQNVTTSVVTDATIDGEYMGYGGFLHGTIIPRATAKMPLMGAVPVMWNGEHFVTPTGETVTSMKRAVIIDHTIIGWGINS